jgi:class 3 adenylate cyclase
MENLAVKSDFEKLQEQGNFDSNMIQVFNKFLLNSNDAETFRINPFSFSKTYSLDSEKVLKLFLHATHLGILNFNWNMICSCCGGYHESFNTMKGLHSFFSCSVCNHDTHAKLDDFIQVSFTISKKLRENKFTLINQLSIDEFIDHILFSKDGHFGDNKPISDSHKSIMIKKLKINQLSEENFDIPINLGIVEFQFIFFGSLTLKVDEQGSNEVVIEITASGIKTTNMNVKNGNLKVTIKNSINTQIFFFIFQFPVDFDYNKPMKVYFNPFLSARKLLSNQTFRELFRYETISQEEGLSVKDITILFTDLKGSTELYDTIGDLAAFALVKQHFELLKMIIDRHKGAIVKTIGDAVMATFEYPNDALKASVSILEEINEFNKKNPGGDLNLKIGFHRGEAIAVNSNDRMDYFGQNVNIAARVQGLAGSQQIYFTEEVLYSEEVKHFVESKNISSKIVNLKGIKEQKKVYYISA